MCYLLLVSPEYVLSLRALQNFVEKMVIRRMVKNKQMPWTSFYFGEFDYA